MQELNIVSADSTENSLLIFSSHTNQIHSNAYSVALPKNHPPHFYCNFSKHTTGVMSYLSLEFNKQPISSFERLCRTSIYFQFALTSAIVECVIYRYMWGTLSCLSTMTSFVTNSCRDAHAGSIEIPNHTNAKLFESVGNRGNCSMWNRVESVVMDGFCALLRLLRNWNRSIWFRFVLC